MNSDRLEPFFLAFRATLVASLFVGLWVWLALLVRRFDVVIGLAVPTPFRLLGALIAVAGGFLALYCVVAFAVRGKGTAAPFDPPRVFVAQGPYRFVRNPMYVGGISLILGSGLALGSVSIALLAGFALLASHLFVVFYEEPALTRRFGGTYLQYKAGVSRWLVRPPTRDRLRGVG